MNFVGETYNYEDNLAYSFGAVTQDIFINDIIDNAPAHKRNEASVVLRGFKKACMNGDDDIVKRAMQYPLSRSMYTEGLRVAIKNENVNIVNIILDHVDSTFIMSDIVLLAIECLELQEVKRIFHMYRINENNLYDYTANGFMVHACEYGMIEVVQFFLDQGANDYNRGLEVTNRLNVAKLMIDKGARKCKTLSPALAFSLFNDGYEIDNPHIKEFMRKDVIDTKHKIIKMTIDDGLRIFMYDINITNIICSYIAYGID